MHEPLFIMPYFILRSFPIYAPPSNGIKRGSSVNLANTGTKDLPNQISDRAENAAHYLLTRFEYLVAFSAAFVDSKTRPHENASQKCAWMLSYFTLIA